MQRRPSGPSTSPFLAREAICINPVAIELCRSGECMCGTMQTQAERREASAIYPEWGSWLSELEREVIARHAPRAHPRTEHASAGAINLHHRTCNRWIRCGVYRVILVQYRAGSAATGVGGKYLNICGRHWDVELDGKHLVVLHLNGGFPAGCQGERQDDINLAARNVQWNCLSAFHHHSNPAERSGDTSIAIYGEGDSSLRPQEFAKDRCNGPWRKPAGSVAGTTNNAGDSRPGSDSERDGDGSGASRSAG